jgi:hypothetical protein
MIKNTKKNTKCNALVMKLVNIADLKSAALYGLGGSSPPKGTTYLSLYSPPF